MYAENPYEYEPTPDELWQQEFADRIAKIKRAQYVYVITNLGVTLARREGFDKDYNAFTVYTKCPFGGKPDKEVRSWRDCFITEREAYQAYIAQMQSKVALLLAEIELAERKLEVSA